MTKLPGHHFLFLIFLAGTLSAVASDEASQPVPDPRRRSDLRAAEQIEEASAPALAHREPEYRLCKGDVFDLEFPLTPEFSQPAVTVQPDGFISVRGVGQVHALGQTVPELSQTLRGNYAKILHEPVINVILKDFDKPCFIASGQVAHPGKFELRGDLTVTQGLAIAGGLTMIAKHSQVLLFRRISSDRYGVIKVNVKRILQAGNTSEDIHLQPGDMLFVPTSQLGNIKRIVPGWGLSTYVNPIP